MSDSKGFVCLTQSGRPTEIQGLRNEMSNHSESLESLERKWKAAMRRWNRAAGEVEAVRSGEELYFSALFLIDALKERLVQGSQLPQKGVDVV